MEDNCRQNNDGAVFTDAGTINILPPANLVRKLSLLLNGDSWAVINSPTKVYILNFTDINLQFTLTLRNSILEIEEGVKDNYDVKISVDLQSFRAVILRKSSLEEAGAMVEPNLEAGNTFMTYFDDPSLDQF